ncbi:MAG TPA: Wzz/FepE/Etk N-terminal domain-containing protein [Caproiciproducens sp.]|nr:Wzz/FepE/Etk N-terminal domain-containing protein [Caproiciproducens sp.]
MDISVKDFFKLLVKNLIFILICAVVGLACAFSIFKFLVKPTYISSVKLYVYAKDTTSNTQYNNLNDLNYAQKVVNTYIEMLRTDSFYKSVKDSSKVDYSIDELKKMIQFTILNDTEVFQVSVSSHNPEEAKEIADTITELAPKTISSIKESALLKVVDSASFPTNASSPNVSLNSIIGFLLGVIASMIYIVLKEMLDVRIKQEDDLTARYNIPILGTIPAFETRSTKADNSRERGSVNG